MELFHNLSFWLVHNLTDFVEYSDEWLRCLLDPWLPCDCNVLATQLENTLIAFKVCNFPLSGIKPLLVGFRLFDENDTEANDINKVKWIDCADSMKPLLCRIREAMSRLAYLSSGIGCGE